ncbi:MAG: recombinase family protein, partial [Bilifractor sp.]
MGRNRKSARASKKNRIRERYNQKVDELEIHEVTPKEAVRKAPGTIRKVAAYCRVSTQEEQQTSSFELQVKTYTDLINNTPDYQLVNIYADEGISG